MQQRVTQKHTMRRIVVAGSLFSLMIGSIIYFNFSNNTNSFANKNKEEFQSNLRTTSIEVPTRLLRSNQTSQRLNNDQFEFGKNRVLISRGSDEITISKNEGGEEWKN